LQTASTKTWIGKPIQTRLNCVTYATICQLVCLSQQIHTEQTSAKCCRQRIRVVRSLSCRGLKDTGKIRAGVSGTLGAVPLIGEALSRGSDNIFNTLPTILGGLNEDQQKTIQARVNFITAVLRKESGASISPTEFATAEKNYFPSPGDPKAIVEQKQKARELAIRGMKLQAGPGAKYINSDITSSGW